MKPIQELSSDIQRVQATLSRKLAELPAILGEEAVRMSRTQIEKQGTIDGGFKPWPKRKLVALRALSTSIERGKNGKYTATNSNYAESDQFSLVGRGLMRVSGNLYNAITYRIDGNTVHVGVDLKTIPYAQIHNEGGNITITRKMRGFFMGKFRETLNPFWFNMARHKGSTITMPKRQYLALTPELKNAFDKAMFRFITKDIPNLT